MWFDRLVTEPALEVRVDHGEVQHIAEVAPGGGAWCDAQYSRCGLDVGLNP